MRLNTIHATLAVAVAVAAGTALAQSQITTLRSAPLDQNAEAPPMRPQVDQSLRPVRNYPEQPPIIPHSIDGYEVSADFNRCLSCHARAATEQSQAPMVSVTHYMDREGQTLAQVSPRRYFCNQCHVPQHPNPPAVANTFIDIDTLLSQSPDAGE